MNDNNASDWIYLLMALVAGGLSMIKSLSKKKPIPSHPHPAEEIDEEEEWPEENGNQRTEPIIVEEYSDYYKNRIVATETEILKGGDYYKEKLAMKHTESEEPRETTEEEGDFQFDLKKAILYNEILNRKYD